MPEPFNDQEQLAVVRGRINQGWAELGDLETLAYGPDVLVPLSDGVTLDQALHSELHSRRVVLLRHATDRDQPVIIQVPDGLTRAVELMIATDQVGECRLVRASGATCTLNGGLAVTLDVARAVLEVTALNVYRVTEISSTIGDMEASVYDPTNVAADAFSMDNMTDGVHRKAMTAVERERCESFIVAAGLAIMAGQEARIVIPEQPDIDYFIQLTPNTSETVSYNTLTPTGFRIRSSNANSNAFVRWQVTRAKARGVQVDYLANLVRFNGATRLLRGGNITNVADGKYVRGGFWFRRYAGFGIDMRILGNLPPAFWIRFDFAGRIVITCSNSNKDILNTLHSGAITDNKIHHCAFGVRTDAADARIWIDNEESSDDAITNGIIDLSSTNWAIGATPATVGAAYLTCDLADVFIQTGVNAPMDETAVRSLITAGGAPVPMATTIAQLGPAQVAITGPAATWHQNTLGTGGAFTVEGALTDVPDLVYLKGW